MPESPLATYLSHLEKGELAYQFSPSAGGAVFSWAIILAANGLVLLLMLKVLFPESVMLGRAFQSAYKDGWWLWKKSVAFCLPAFQALQRKALS